MYSKINLYLLEIYNRFFNNLFKILTNFYSITGKFFTKAVVKIQANPTIIWYGIASIPLAVFIFIYLWYGPNFADPIPPPSAPGISAAIQRSMVDRFCSELNVFRDSWCFLSAEIKSVLQPFFEPLLAIDFDTWRSRRWDDPDLPNEMREIGKEVVNRLAEEKSQSSSSFEQLGSVHKKVFSPVGVSTAIIMLTFCLTKVAVAILV